MGAAQRKTKQEPWVADLRRVRGEVVASRANLETCLANDANIEGMYWLELYSQTVWFIGHSPYDTGWDVYDEWGPMTAQHIANLKSYLQLMYSFAPIDPGLLWEIVSDLARDQLFCRRGGQVEPVPEGWRL